MGSAVSKVNILLKNLDAEWSSSEKMSWSQTKALVEFFDLGLYECYRHSSSTFADRERPSKVTFDNLLNAMSKCVLKPRNAYSIMYPSFYEHYFNPFLQCVTEVRTSELQESPPKSQRCGVKQGRGSEDKEGRERDPPSSKIPFSFINILIPDMLVVYIW